MDWLLQIKDPLEKEIFLQVANLLNLEVDLLFSGTTSTCFETEDEDEPVPRVLPGQADDQRDELVRVPAGVPVAWAGATWPSPGGGASAAACRVSRSDGRAALWA